MLEMGIRREKKEATVAVRIPGSATSGAEGSGMLPLTPDGMSQ
jgi:hypothetical protein